MNTTCANAGNESTPGNASDALCYKVEWDLDLPGFKPSQVITPIYKMPTEHPSAKEVLCGSVVKPGDPIPSNGAGPYDENGVCRYNLTSGELFYGWSYPYGWSANTGYYNMDAATIYLIVDDAGHEYLVMTLDAPESGSPGYLGLDIKSTGLDKLKIVLMDDFNEAYQVGRQPQYGTQTTAHPHAMMLFALCCFVFMAYMTCRHALMVTHVLKPCPAQN